MIEDDADAMLLVKSALAGFADGRYCLVWAKTLQEGLRDASEDAFDVVLLDLGLPDSSGPISYAWVRRRALHVPIVVLTGDENQETREAVIACGAKNYLLKQNTSGPLLVRAIEAAVRDARNHEENSRLIENAKSAYRVLLIEDDEDAMLLVRCALHECGDGRFAVEWTTSLQMSLERLTAQDFDVVLLDLGLPDSTGVAGYLKLHEAYPKLPVIVLTASKCIEIEFALLACGADDYLDKCLTSGPQIIRAIEGVVEEARMRQLIELQRLHHQVRFVSNMFWGI